MEQELFLDSEELIHLNIMDRSEVYIFITRSQYHKFI